jgi:hypothetical protein
MTTAADGAPLESARETDVCGNVTRPKALQVAEIRPEEALVFSRFNGIDTIAGCPYRR